MVLRNALAVGIHDPEVELCAGVSLVGREAIPPDGLGVVLWNALTVGISHAEVELRGGIPLLGGTANSLSTILTLDLFPA